MWRPRTTPERTSARRSNSIQRVAACCCSSLACIQPCGSGLVERTVGMYEAELKNERQLSQPTALGSTESWSVEVSRVVPRILWPGMPSRLSLRIARSYK